MSRAFVKEGDSTTSGSLVDRSYQGLLDLSDPARTLVGKRQQQAWLTSLPKVEAARRQAQAALGADSYREIFDAAAQRAGDPSQSPTWWAVGDAATALAARRHLDPDEFALLVGPLGVAFPWLKDAASQT
jgi:NADPH-dependent ferric siderophore reductase